LAPKARIAFDPPSGTASAPAMVTFDASGSSDPDGEIADYSWSVNGVHLGASEKLRHTLEAGTHQVSLQVTDDRGAFHEATSQYVVNVGSPSSSGTIRFIYDGAYVPAEGLEDEITELDGRQIWIEADEPWKLTVESRWLSVDPSSGDAGLTPVTLTLLGDEVERAPYATNFIYAWPIDEEPSAAHEMFIAVLADVPLMSEPTIDALERKLPTELV